MINKKNDNWNDVNSKIVKLLFVIVFFVIIIILFLFNNHFFQDKYLINEILSVQKIDEIKKTRKEYKNDITLYYQKSVIPFSSVDNYYLFYLRNGDDYKKIYTLTDFKIVVTKLNSHTISLLLYNDEYYKETRIEFTNIPIVNITDEEIKLYGFTNDVPHYSVYYSIRGDSSQEGEKKSYKLRLMHSKNKKVEVELLGMKKSDTWILNPIYFDNSYIREKIAYDIWNNLSNQFNHGLEYVEVIINNEYLGLYYLQESVDIETFSGNKNNDLLVSIKSWGNIKNQMTKDMLNEIKQYEVDAGFTDYNLQTSILKSFNNFIIDYDFDVTLKNDLLNSIDYNLFLNLVSAQDNIYKNQKILFRKQYDGYLIQKTIWDLDWALSNEKINDYYPELVNEINELYFDVTIPISVKNSTIFNKLWKLKYFLFRVKYYNIINLNNLIDKYTTYLNTYGAISREQSKWVNENYEKSVNNIRMYFKERIKILDEYYGGF